MRKIVGLALIVAALIVSLFSSSSVYAANTSHQLSSGNPVYYQSTTGAGSSYSLHEFYAYKSGTALIIYLGSTAGGSFGWQVLDANFNVVPNPQNGIQVSPGDVYYLKVYQTGWPEAIGGYVYMGHYVA
ncbi:hypothetical protein ACU063_09540 [Paenibacillus sp. M.A.Huq-81]